MESFFNAHCDKCRFTICICQNGRRHSGSLRVKMLPICCDEQSRGWPGSRSVNQSIIVVLRRSIECLILLAGTLTAADKPLPRHTITPSPLPPPPTPIHPTRSISCFCHLSSTSVTAVWRCVCACVCVCSLSSSSSFFLLLYAERQQSSC